MTSEPWNQRVEREAAEKIAALLALPVPESPHDGGAGVFDPWDIFPLYGSYSSDFDECALDVLRELQAGVKVRDDLGAEMFREMLCKLHLCSYGTSPRGCFPTESFREQLPAFVEKWAAYSAVQWTDDDHLASGKEKP